jgi:hypothetical protein
MRKTVAALLFGLAVLGPVQGGGGGKFLGQIGGKEVKMVPTGSGVRTKGIFKVYNITSYIEQGTKVATAEQLAAADCPKQLHMEMLLSVSGADMAEAFTKLFRLNYPAPAFEDEVLAFSVLLRGRAANRGDHVWLTHVPGVGLHYRHVGHPEKLIRNVEFSKAFWNNYLGKHNVGEAVKKGLVSKLATR